MLFISVYRQTHAHILRVTEYFPQMPIQIDGYEYCFFVLLLCINILSGKVTSITNDLVSIFRPYRKFYSLR